MSVAKPGLPSGLEASQASIARKGLAGFFLSGLLLAFLGAILPAWRHHLREDFLTVGSYFLSMHAGILLSIALAFVLLPRKSSGFVLVLACGIACGAFLYLAMVPPAAPAGWRMLGTLGVGTGAGLLNRGVFEAISPIYRHNPAATVNLSGSFFGLGCVVISLLVAGTFYVYTVPSILILIALIPGFFGGMYAKSLAGQRGAGSCQAVAPSSGLETSAWEAGRSLKDPVAILLALLLFFQFGNEWSIAGWLPLFLSKRVGVSPASSLVMLTAYWLALLVGRVAASAALPRFRHGTMLAGSVLAALFGCTILAFTNNRFGAVTGILFVGAGFAPVYPLVVEMIGGRFPAYHPGRFNGILSFGVTGGLLAPWSLGFFAHRWGVGAIIAVPLLGTLMVFVLLVLIWAEAKFTAAEKREEGGL